MNQKQTWDYDYIIVGSGFGGSVSAHRLSEKGYKVLVIEKGKWFKADDFPTTNWDLKRWMWLPSFKFFGLFKMTFFRHVGVVSGVGVGGGSLVYANTLPVPSKKFFNAESWSHLASWEDELAPHYKTALKNLGAATNPKLMAGDDILRELSVADNKPDNFHPAKVAVYFGEQNKEVDDPFFDGKGPKRAGCNFCGGCMLGCRHNAKNTLDKNYLYFAQNQGAEIKSETEVVDVQSVSIDGETGYNVIHQPSTRGGKKGTVSSKGIIFAGGVLGTIRLLLSLKEKSLPKLSNKLGTGIRTNSEALISVTTAETKTDYSQGIAIGSIYNTDEHSHVEPVRYPAGAGFWRSLMMPLVHNTTFLGRVGGLLGVLVRQPIQYFKIFTVPDWAKQTQILLFMQTLDSTLRFTKSGKGMKTELDTGAAPTAFIPEAKRIADEFAKRMNGKPMTLLSESLLGIPTTAHILGGAVMGVDASEGVIDKNNKVFGYDNMYICDGSTISANIGVNPSLTITALTERAMSKIPNKEGAVPDTHIRAMSSDSVG